VWRGDINMPGNLKQDATIKKQLIIEKLIIKSNNKKYFES
jgi:hypothetical protein